MGIADEVLPPDRADQAPVTAPLRELLRLMTRGEGHRPSIEIDCDPDAYDKLRTYFQRPYRGQPSTFALPLAEGTVWFRRTSLGVLEGRPKAGQAIESLEGRARDAEDSIAAGAWPTVRIPPVADEPPAVVLRSPFVAGVTSTAPGGAGSAVYVGKYTEPKEKPE